MTDPRQRRKEATTRLVLDAESDPGRLPVVRWIGARADHLEENRPDRLSRAGGLGQPDDSSMVALAGPHRGTPLLIEQSRGTLARPGLRGHRLATSGGRSSRDIAGRDWSTMFRPSLVHADSSRVVIEGEDVPAGLSLRTEVESLDGGALRARHVLTNLGEAPYLLAGVEIAVPVPDTFIELMDFTGRHERERVPQRHLIGDGLWVRESRGGRPGLDSASALIAGTCGFGFGTGEVIAVLVASSGNSTLSLQRSGADGPTLSAGELLLPGEIVLASGEVYTMPWVIVVAATDGLDSMASALHRWQRSLDAHPDVQPVTLNVWEAVYFDHDLAKLMRLADLAAEVGVERFVLDDGWFRGRRDDRAGLGDWWVDGEGWPEGLEPLIDHVRALGMEFGLWFEPEMVNPDSDLFRSHPDWILSTGGRVPLLHRNQLVLDLTNHDAWTYLRDRICDILDAHEIDYVKWDHNRDLLEAGSAHHGGAPGAHEQNLAYYALLDDLRERHPRVAWESCASGGGRIDFGVLERVQRVWTSDMTDALARQQIQRWTQQIVAPEYLGAHVSAPTSHQTGRTLPLDFRAATAMFGAFGIEWDLTQATRGDLDRLAQWCRLHKQYRSLLHGGRMVRMETSDPAGLAHGVISEDASLALVAHVQMDESAHNRGVVICVPRLDPHGHYRLSWEGPEDGSGVPPAGDPAGPSGGVAVSGAMIAEVGIWLPRRQPETIQLIRIERV